MIKFYTPKAWYSTFGNYPSLVMEDDGMIYSEADYYKSLRNPVGKVNWEQKLIYGPDYFHTMAQPIGRIKENGKVTEIYGSDYYTLSAKPILYIRDNRVYSSDEFYKLFPHETGFIKNESAVGGKSDREENAGFSTSNASEAGNDIGNAMESAWNGIKTTAVIVFAIIVLFLLTKFVFIDNISDDPEMAKLAWECLAVGAWIGICVLVVNFKDLRKNPDFGRAIILAIEGCFGGSIVGMFVLDIIMPVVNGEVEFNFLVTLVAPFGYALTFFVPSLLVGLVVGAIFGALSKRFRIKDK